MHRGLRFFFTTAILVFFLSTLFPTAAMADRESEILSQIDQINAQNAETISKINAKKANQNGLLAEMAALDQKITPIKQEIERLTGELNAKTAERAETERQIEAIKAKIAETVSELDKAKLRLARQQKLLNRRIKNIYQHGEKPYIQVVLESASFSDFINRMSLLSYIVRQDARILDQIKETKRQIEIKEAKLQEDKRVLEQKRLAVLEQEKAIARLRGEQDVKRAALQAEIDKRAAIVSRLEQDLNALKAAAEQEAADAQRLKANLQAWRAEQARAMQQSSRAVQRSYEAGAYGWVWPTGSMADITSPFGWRIHPITGQPSFHTGVDIAVGYGTPIRAANSGLVIFVGYNGAYGNFIAIDHGNGLSSAYAHLDSYAVGSGEYVQAGQVVGYVGSTGWSTGPHLHFEIRVDGEAANPLDWY